MGNFAANQIYRIMYSSEDLERFYFQYQTEALTRGESLQSFCVKNKVPYNIFQKWFKDTRKKVVEVQVDGAPEITHEEKTKIGDRSKPVSRSGNDNPVRIWIDIRISNGLHLSQKNLSYQDLVRMIEKLEGLCWVLPVWIIFIMCVTLPTCVASTAVLSIIFELLHR